jgi:HPt (histidine-containing phosphotransfer) domain-containing protein
MTAAAMDGDRDKCLAAGMDDYITKPVRIETVSDALERWSAGTVLVEEPAVEDKRAEDLEVPAALDEDQISLLRSLDGGAGELLCEIVEQFIIQTIDGRELVAKSLGACDSETVARVTHTLKGASANVGAAALSEVCAGLETQARNGLLDGANDLMEQFDVEFARAREAFVSLSSDVSSRR